LMIYYWQNRQKWSGSLNSMYRICGISKQGYYKINPMYMGRDRFESLCRANGFIVNRKKSRKRTTNSVGVIRFENLLKQKALKGINEAWSSDITYFEIENCFYYITFIMDCYSRKILGAKVSSRLLTQHTTLPCIEQAIKSRKKKIPKGMIFHSDGGGQYFAKEFLELTNQYSMQNSMCEYAYENGKAERLNGVIKNNYLKHYDIKSLPDLIKGVDRAVKLYNEDKPHSSLGRLSPVEFENKLATFEQQSLKKIPNKKALMKANN